jgi:hypothetical protein
MRFHIALSCNDLQATVADYRVRLGTDPMVVVPDEYALFRTAQINLSIRQDRTVPSGQLRHLGWEDPTAQTFTSETDALGIQWERFNPSAQAAEIEATWPGTDCTSLRRGTPL